MAEFALEVVQKLLRGENPLPHDSHGRLNLNKLPIVGDSGLQGIIARYGIEKAEELFNKYVEKDPVKGGYRRKRVSSTSSTDSD
jgi:hypothetical protein